MTTLKVMFLHKHDQQIKKQRVIFIIILVRFSQVGLILIFLKTTRPHQTSIAREDRQDQSAC